MRDLVADQLMALMEAGSGRPDADRAQLMLAWGYPERKWQDIAALAVGARDAMLFRLRQRLFGNRSKLSCHCPQCQANFEFDADISDILAVTDGTDFSRQSPGCDGAEEMHQGLKVKAGRGFLYLRPVSGRDLAALPAHLSEDEAVRFLVARAIVSATGSSGKPVPVPPPGDLKENWIEAAEAALAKKDPLSVVAFGLACADCNHEWRAFFDAAQLLWGELRAENDAVLEEIHLLAKNYGWSEADIVAIPQARRRAYANKLSERNDD